MAIKNSFGSSSADEPGMPKTAILKRVGVEIFYMKKLLIFLILATSVLSGFIVKKTTETNKTVDKLETNPFCTSKFCELVQVFNDSSDVLVKSVDELMETWSESQQQEFFEYLDTAGIANTALHYNVSESAILSIESSLHAGMLALLDIAYEYFGRDTINISELETLLDSINECDYLIVPPDKRIDPGECEEELKDCLSAASDSYWSGIAACGEVGLGITLAGGGGPVSWFGLGAGLGCMTWEYIAYSRAKKRCNRAYDRCDD